MKKNSRLYQLTWRCVSLAGATAGVYMYVKASNEEYPLYVLDNLAATALMISALGILYVITGEDNDKHEQLK